MRLWTAARRLSALLALAAAVTFGSEAATAARQSRPAAVPAGLRLYVFDGGPVMNGGIAVAYLIQYPKGTLMWEAGTLPDPMVQNPAAARSAVLDKFNARGSRRSRNRPAPRSGSSTTPGSSRRSARRRPSYD